MKDTRIAVLVVDDDPAVAALTKIYAAELGFGKVDAAYTAEAGLAALHGGTYDLVLLDLGLPDKEGFDALHEFLDAASPIPIAVVTADDRLVTAVACMRAGAFDFVEKPVSPARLISLLSHAAESARLRHLIDADVDGDRSIAFSRIITTSPLMKNLFRALERLAPSTLPMLINGESGTGKELVARAVHELSHRPGDFVPVNTAGLDGTLFSDVLFGHIKGAYTGADGYRPGLVRRASKGTLFLDEIGDINVETQVKLLRFIQDGEFYPLGSDNPERGDCRLVLATNVDLYEAVRAGRFRADLYYRLTAHSVAIPPLRDRREDLPILTEHFSREAAAKLGLPQPILSEPFHALIASYDFPGNVRELSAVIYGAVSTSRSNHPSLAYLREYFDHHRNPRRPQEEAACADYPYVVEGRFPLLEELEMQHIREALHRTNGNQSAAAILLGISQSTISRKLGLSSMKNE